MLSPLPLGYFHEGVLGEGCYGYGSKGPPYAETRNWEGQHVEGVKICSARYRIKLVIVKKNVLCRIDVQHLEIELAVELLEQFEAFGESRIKTVVGRVANLSASA